MQWSSLLLIFVGVYIACKLYGFIQIGSKLKFADFFVAAVFFVIMQTSIVVEHLVSVYNMTVFAEVIVEWGQVLCLSFILSALAVFIRDSKPVFAQFPLVYTALPLLTVVSFFLVKDTYALKDLLISTYQGGAILVALLMYSVYAYRNKQYAYILAGTLLFMLTFIMYWYVPIVNNQYPWIWKLFLAIAMLITIYGHDKAAIKIEYSK